VIEDVIGLHLQAKALVVDVDRVVTLDDEGLRTLRREGHSGPKH